MQIDTDALKEACDQIDLLEYAEQQFDFEKVGNDSYFTHCPLHIDNTASLAITPSKNLFYCFSCHKGGNILNWLMMYEGLKFPEAVAKVSELSHKDINSFRSCDAMNFYRELRDTITPQSNEDIKREYLDLDKDYDRVYAAETPEEWIKEGITENEIKKYDIRIDKKANRIVYPVLDADYRMIGIKGRTRYSNYKVLKIAKYMNYKKIGTLDFFTGMKQAEPYIRSSGKIIIVEGIKSVMKIDGYGYHNVVSAETSDITESQLALLIKMGVKSAIIAFDEDVKVQKLHNMAETMKRYMRVEAVVNKFGLLTEKMSPCDVGKEGWETLYKERIKI